MPGIKLGPLNFAASASSHGVIPLALSKVLILQLSAYVAYRKGEPLKKQLVFAGTRQGSEQKEESGGQLVEGNLRGWGVDSGRQLEDASTRKTHLVFCY